MAWAWGSTSCSRSCWPTVGAWMSGLTAAAPRSWCIFPADRSAAEGIPRRASGPTVRLFCDQAAGGALFGTRLQSCDLDAPFLRSGVVDRGPVGIDRHGDRHVLPLELVDSFHAEILEGEHLRAADGLRDEVGRTTDGHQICGLMFLDCLDGDGAAFGLADHGDQTGLRKHQLSELVHASGGRGTCWSHSLLAYRVDWADVVDDPVGEIDWQLLAFCQHVGDALVGGVPTGEHLAG